MLIAMAVWDTEENQRTEMTRATLWSLLETVNLDRHHIIISDNGSCTSTLGLYLQIRKWPWADISKIKVLFNGTNIGTARAINRAWQYRRPEEHAVKMDNDVVIHYSGWADRMEEVFLREPTIGICGLKRKDCEERPDHPNTWFISHLKMLPHKPGETWIVVEDVQHVMGTCQAYSSALLEKIGYLYQMGGLYGFDDALASARAQVAGFKTVFIPWINIDHIDPGGTDYTVWKQKYSGDLMNKFFETREYIRKTGNVYYGLDDE